MQLLKSLKECKLQIFMAESTTEDYILIYGSRFLLPSLHIKMVLGMTTKSKRRKALETLPNDLYLSFTKVIARIRDSSADQA